MTTEPTTEPRVITARLLAQADAFTRGYVVEELWLSVDDTSAEYDPASGFGPSLARTAGESNIDPETLRAVIDECADFVAMNRADLDATGDDDDDLGADFALSRNGHGTGFWDRGYGAVGDRLDAAAKVYGATYWYVDDETGRIVRA
jgi:hypothetical protein